MRMKLMGTKDVKGFDLAKRQESFHGMKSEKDESQIDEEEQNDGAEEQKFFN